MRLARALIRFAMAVLLAIGATVRALAIEIVYVALWPSMWAHDRHPSSFPKIMAVNLAAIAAAMVGLLWLTNKP